jgi:hypothetical protein
VEARHQHDRDWGSVARQPGPAEAGQAQRPELDGAGQAAGKGPRTAGDSRQRQGAEFWGLEYLLIYTYIMHMHFT